jgi:hypothetical protein
MHPTVPPRTCAPWSSSIGIDGRHASEPVVFFVGMPNPSWTQSECPPRLPRGASWGGSLVVRSQSRRARVTYVPYETWRRYHQPVSLPSHVSGDKPYCLGCEREPTHVEVVQGEHYGVNTMTHPKERYETPVLRRIGSFEQITQGNHTGPELDASFPGGTPDSKLTFS